MDAATRRRSRRPARRAAVAGGLGSRRVRDRGAARSEARRPAGPRRRVLADVRRPQPRRRSPRRRSRASATARRCRATRTSRAGDRAARIALFHAPYWDAVRRDVAARLRDRGAVPALLVAQLRSGARSGEPHVRRRRALRSGAPVRGRARRAADVRAARAGLDVRANQPYSGVGPAICTSLRAELAGAATPASSSRPRTRSPTRRAAARRIAAAVVPFLESL